MIFFLVIKSINQSINSPLESKSRSEEKNLKSKKVSSSSSMKPAVSFLPPSSSSSPVHVHLATHKDVTDDDVMIKSSSRIVAWKEKKKQQVFVSRIIAVCVFASRKSNSRSILALACFWSLLLSLARALSLSLLLSLLLLLALSRPLSLCVCARGSR